MTPTDPQGAEGRETRTLLKPDGTPVTDADFPGADDAFRVTLTLTTRHPLDGTERE